MQSRGSKQSEEQLSKQVAIVPVPDLVEIVHRRDAGVCPASFLDAEPLNSSVGKQQCGAGHGSSDNPGTGSGVPNHVGCIVGGEVGPEFSKGNVVEVRFESASCAETPASEVCGLISIDLRRDGVAEIKRKSQQICDFYCLEFIAKMIGESKLARKYQPECLRAGCTCSSQHLKRFVQVVDEFSATCLLCKANMTFRGNSHGSEGSRIPPHLETDGHVSKLEHFLKTGKVMTQLLLSFGARDVTAIYPSTAQSYTRLCHGYHDITHTYNTRLRPGVTESVEVRPMDILNDFPSEMMSGCALQWQAYPFGVGDSVPIGHFRHRQCQIKYPSTSPSDPNDMWTCSWCRKIPSDDAFYKRMMRIHALAGNTRAGRSYSQTGGCPAMNEAIFFLRQQSEELAKSYKHETALEKRLQRTVIEQMQMKFRSARQQARVRIFCVCELLLVNVYCVV
jgi:hypothetical protein